MSRLATIKDVPALAQLFYDEKAQPCFDGVNVEWTVEGCAAFLGRILNDTSYVILIEVDDHGKIVAVCGGNLYHELLPPHPLVIGEWMWMGSDKRATVRVLHDVAAWGKERGAEFIRYTLNSQRKPGQHKFCETNQWKAL